MGHSYPVKRNTVSLFVESMLPKVTSCCLYRSERVQTSESASACFPTASSTSFTACRCQRTLCCQLPLASNSKHFGRKPSTRANSVKGVPSTAYTFGWADLKHFGRKPSTRANSVKGVPSTAYTFGWADLMCREVSRDSPRAYSALLYLNPFCWGFQRLFGSSTFSSSVFGGVVRFSYTALNERISRASCKKCCSYCRFCSVRRAKQNVPKIPPDQTNKAEYTESPTRTSHLLRGASVEFFRIVLIRSVFRVEIAKCTQSYCFRNRCAKIPPELDTCYTKQEWSSQPVFDRAHRISLCQLDATGEQTAEQTALLIVFEAR